MITLPGFLTGLAFLLALGFVFGRGMGKPLFPDGLLYGWGLAAALIAWLGLLPGQWLVPERLLPLLVVAAALAWWLAKRRARPATTEISAAADPLIPLGRVGRWLLVLVALHLLIAAAGIVVPPVGNDALTYHLPLPAFYLRAGRLADTADIMNATFPQGMEMLWLVALIFNPAGHLPQAIEWLCLLALAMLLVKLTRRAGFPDPWPYAAPLLLLATPMLNRLGGYLNVDIPLAAFSALAMLALLRDESLGALAAAGMAATCKYTGLLILLATAAWLLAAAIVRREPRRAGYVLLGGLLVTIIFPGPWLLRNWLNTGAPLYPFAQQLHETTQVPLGDAPAVALDRIAGQFADKGYTVYENRWIRLLRFPFDITFEFWKFDDWRYALGPWYLALIPVGLGYLAWRRCGPAIFVAAVHALGVVLLAPNARYLLPGLPGFLLVVIAGAAGLAGRHPAWRAGLLGLILGWGALNLPLAAAQQFPNLRLLARVGYAGFYPAKLDFWDGVDYLQRIYGPLARPAVCIVEKRIFPLPFEPVGGLRGNLPRYPFPLADDDTAAADQFAAALHTRNADFVLIGKKYVVTHDNDDRLWRLCDRLAAGGHAANLFESPNSVVYQIVPAPTPPIR